MHWTNVQPSTQIRYFPSTPRVHPPPRNHPSSALSVLHAWITGPRLQKENLIKSPHAVPCWSNPLLSHLSIHPCDACNWDCCDGCDPAFGMRFRLSGPIRFPPTRRSRSGGGGGGARPGITAAKAMPSSGRSPQTTGLRGPSCIACGGASLAVPSLPSSSFNNVVT